MVDLLILAEKASAEKVMEKAFGGKTGTFDGQTFRLTKSRGHLLTLRNPEDMVHDPAKKERYASWTDMDTMPWDLSDFDWKKTYIEGVNPRTHKRESTRPMVEQIKQDASDAKAIVIATDNDPSGEGDLLGWEIINAIGWHGPVYRMRFTDDTPKPLQISLRNKIDVTDQMKQGEYLKAESRNRWDYTSMQLTRIATLAARQAGYAVRVVNQGRLKSVIVLKVWQQLDAIKHYVRTPFWEVKYKDPANHIYTRRFKDDAAAAAARFKDKSAGDADLANYQTAHVTNIKKTRKTQAPGALLDLGTLGSVLNKQGYDSKDILATYQKMYEAGIVSYPRTEDTKVTSDQYQELLPLVDKIAAVVGVDKALLTHRTLRPKHAIKVADHGANRPGLNVPASLSALDQYGASAKAIYKTLALNYLAILGEDYVYDQVTAELAEHPEFKTSFAVPVALNYKAIFDDADNDDHDDDDEQASGQVAGPTADPYLCEGANPKPRKPTSSWILNFLKQKEIGTGATRLSTMAQLTSGSNPLLKNSRGNLNVTDSGTIAAVLANGTWIGSPDITKQLFDAMDAVGKFKFKPADVLTLATNVVKHDKPLMIANAKKLRSVVGEPKGKLKAQTFVKKDKVGGQYKDGTAVQFNAEWGGHKFTDPEVKQLLAGDTIEIDYRTKAGKRATVKGALKQQSYKGHSFWGFKADFK